MVSQKIHLKANFTNTAIPSGMGVRQIPMNYQSISGKWKETAWKPNHALVSHWSCETT